MRHALDLLSRYAAFHRDRRNIAIHLVGVPMIVLALGVLAGRPGFELQGWSLSPAWLLFLLAAVWYPMQHLTLGAATAAGIGVLLLVGQPLAAGSTAAWLSWGLGLFFVGWAIKSIGYYYEGRRPALVMEPLGLAIAPMFVTAELLFQCGWNRPLAEAIETRVGPTVLRDLAHPA